MHNLEPFYNWRDYYIAEEDPKSPFLGRAYSEFTYSDKIYNHYIHPQWDDINSPTLYIKLIFADYLHGFAIIEFIGEWNDAINNDIMTLKRDIIDHLSLEGIHKYILIGENILNMHTSDDCYYEEWHEDTLDNDGWVCLINFRDHILKEMDTLYLNNYLHYPEELQEFHWRKYKPLQLFNSIENILFSEEVIDLQEYTLIN
jgi:hypothetical protein